MPSVAPTPDAARSARQTAVIAGLPALSPSSTSREAETVSRLASLVEAAARATGLRRGTLNLFDGDLQRQVGAYGFTASESPREDSICAQITGSAPDVYAFRDLTTEPGFAGNPWVDGRRANVRAYASAPLAIDGTTIGTLCVFDESPRTLSLQQCDRLAELAAEVVDLLGDATR
ncbi:GAF domain-containing protein [Geodermatophilus nigrescens]